MGFKPDWSSGGVLTVFLMSVSFALLLTLSFSCCVRPLWRYRSRKSAGRRRVRRTADLRKSSLPRTASGAADSLLSESSEDYESDASHTTVLSPSSPLREMEDVERQPFGAGPRARFEAPLDERDFSGQPRASSGIGLSRQKPLWRIGDFVWWAVAAHRVPLTLVGEAVGSDALHYLRFVRTIGILLGFVSVLALGVALPVNLLGDAVIHEHLRNGTTITRDVVHFGKTTIYHVRPDSPWSWVHVGVCAVVSLLSLVVFDQLREYFRVNFPQGAVARRPTSRISNNSGLSIYTVTDSQSVQLTHSATAHTVWIRNLAPRSKIDAAVLGGFLQAAGDIPVTARSLSTDPAVRRDSAIAAAVALLVQRAADLSIEDSEKPDDVPHVVMSACAPGGNCFVTFSAPQDARWFAAEGKGLMESMMATADSVLAEAAAPREKNFPLDVVATASAFAMLRGPGDISVVAAPDSDDLNWNNIGVTGFHRAMRVLCVNLGLCVVLLLLTVPPALMTVAPSVASWSGFPEYLTSVIEGDSDNDPEEDGLQIQKHVLENLLFSFLPSLVLLIITSAIPNIFVVVQPAERVILKSEEENRVFHKSFWFLICFVLIFPSALLTTTDALVLDTLEEEGVLVAFMPNSGAFFVNFLLCICFIANFAELARPMDVMPSFLFVRSRGFRPAKFQFGTQYAWVTAIFAATLFFTCVVPLVVPVGALYFYFKYYVDKFNLCFSCPLPDWAFRQRQRRDGSISMHSMPKALVDARESHTARSALTYLLVGVLLYAMGMVYYMIARNTQWEAVVIGGLVCVFLLAFGWRQWKRHMFWAGARKRRLAQRHRPDSVRNVRSVQEPPESRVAVVRKSKPGSNIVEPGSTLYQAEVEVSPKDAVDERIERYLRQVARESYGRGSMDRQPHDIDSVGGFGGDDGLG